MSENTKTCDVILDKKMDKYTFEENDFLASGELTVTITLSEYRKLVQEVATKKADIDEANKNRYTRDEENKKLKAEIAELKAKLYELNEKRDENA